MPPAGLPRPDHATYDALATWLEGQLDAAAAAHPNPGSRPSLHRLNRTEYQNAIRDLLGLSDLPRELDIAVLLPADDASYGFDNIAEALGTSPTLLERYLTAAQKISRLAIGDPTMPTIVDTYRLPPQLPQEHRIDGFPHGTRGGMMVHRHFPLDGEYLFRLGVGGGRATEPHQLDLMVDGERVHAFTLEDASRGRGARGNAYAMAEQAPPVYQLRHFLKAGNHTVTATFVMKTSALAEDVLRPFSRSGQAAAPPQPALTSITISGPTQAIGSGDTPSRRRIFICHPSQGAAEEACASHILTTLARRAYRRPVTNDDLQVLIPFFNAGKTEGGFELGIQRALERILVSPSFVFRVERQPTAGTAAPRLAGETSRVVAPVSDIELASRLSFFLWSSIPDDELLNLASSGGFSSPGRLEQQVRRMLADGRSRALVDNFAGQWLFLRNIEGVSPDPRVFPDFDEGLRRAMRKETELFVEGVIRNDRSVMELLTADYTFLNERLAKHYGIPHVYGDQFRRVELGDNPRRGLLGHASILTVTSYSHRTSPVLRGKWMLENILGAPPPPPPPDIPALEETSKKTGKALTMREAMVLHRQSPACSSCHSRMDPLGFALENFDAVGRWRHHVSNTPIDASGVLPDGTRFDGARGLVEVVTSHPDAFATTFTERLLTYALGRGLEYFDAPAVRAVGRTAAGADYRFSSFVVGIVKSVPFQMRGVPASTGHAAVAELTTPAASLLVSSNHRGER